MHMVAAREAKLEGGGRRGEVRREGARGREKEGVGIGRGGWRTVAGEEGGGGVWAGWVGGGGERWGGNILTEQAIE